MVLLALMNVLRSNMSSFFRSIFTLLFSAILFGGFWVLPVNAQVADQVNDSLTVVGEGSGLSNQDLPTTIAKIINVVISLSGIILLVLVIYAGFLWMTAAGNSEQVDKAKRILVQAVIGLIIVFASFAITQFVISSLSNATGLQDGGSGGDDDDDGGGLGGSGSTSFTVAGVVPQGEVLIRNIVVQATFSRVVDESSVNNNSFQVVRVSDQEEVDGDLIVLGNRISFTPDQTCPDPNGDRFCFDENTAYEIRLTGDLESTNGRNLTTCANGCSYLFTSGSVVDVENPTVRFTVPAANERVSVNEVVPVQVFATDDYAVAGSDFAVDQAFFDSVGVPGVQTEVAIDSAWDTTTPVATVENTSYTLLSQVRDLAGNTATAQRSVRATPAHCFNGVVDSGATPPEEGLDCGGVCGACNGGACTENDQCSSGACLNGTCQSIPVISDVSPRDGAPGTYVTVTGSGFESVAGIVYFSDGSGGLVPSAVTACGEGWSATEIIVAVPEGAVDGPLTLQTNSGLEDTTNNDTGAFIEDFDVNTLERPSICRLAPNSSPSGSFVDVIGVNFGTTEAAVLFEGAQTVEARTYASWSDSEIELTVPSVRVGLHDVFVRVGGIESNKVQFNASEILSNAPVLATVAPASGGAGQYVTFSGSNFGTATGLVYFENVLTGVKTIADTNFPAVCAEGFWRADEVVVKVPDVDEGAYFVSVERGTDGADSNTLDFLVTNAAPTPGICSVSPARGLEGADVVISGENFGSQQGRALFYNEVSAINPVWGTSQISVTVPDGTSTGPLVIENAAGVQGNSVLFELGETDGDVDDAGAVAQYSWTFSTGQIPIAPSVVQACNENTISAVPNAVFSQNVCVNALVVAEFDTLMRHQTITNQTILLERCDSASCASASAVGATVSASSSADRTAFSLQINQGNGRLSPSTTYRVTVSDLVQSLDGTPMNQPFSWTFTTSTSSEDCDVEEVRVSPTRQTLSVLDQQAEYRALPVFGDCQVLVAEDYSWQWSVDESVASIDDTCDEILDGSCATVSALAEGEAVVTASSIDSGISGTGDLVVQFTDPFVQSFWPACSLACVNAQVGASFNIPVLAATVERSGAVALYECSNEFCTDLTLVSENADCVDGSDGCEGFTVRVNQLLRTSTYYRVVVSGDVQSQSGVPLTRLNYGEDYSWTFLTRADAQECAVARVDLSPGNAQVEVVGATQRFTATPFGEADACSVAGQRLNAYGYSWDWTNPIDSSSQSDDNIASWVTLGGELFDANPSSIPAGCSSACTAVGSFPLFAICGNNVVETGEDCDDGNTTGGDGCSSMCLNEGVVGGVCGNTVLDAGEECDDGNSTNGDGCSDMCLREGSQASGLTCGDGIVSRDTRYGGEDCDDGNKKGGDGCSAVCLNEGSQSISTVAAACGNGVVETPYETCDDGNGVSGDGCSNRCLREGISATVATGFICGNGVTERLPSGGGEDCDGGEGCSVTCRFEGSSTDYSTPSVCGDGIAGIGELAMCEAGYSGDGFDDPVQLAVIDGDAAQFVDESGLATQSIEVTLAPVTATANLQLSCSANSDADCPVGFGADQNGCCSERPTITAFPNGANACLNSAIYVTSNREMDLASFDDAAYVVYEGASCPQNHTTLALYRAVHKNWFARAWISIQTFFVRGANAQVSGDCVVPVERFVQSKVSDTEYRISFITNTLLEAGAPYAIVLEAGAEGVTTSTGVALANEVRQSFSTGSEICRLSQVEIVDETGVVPGLFRSLSETHDMIALPYAVLNGVRSEIQPVQGVYSWNWLPWQEDSGATLFSVQNQTTTPDRASVSTLGENGEATLVAQAQIIENSAPTGVVVDDTLRLRALLCENPWPSADLFPFEDSQAGFDRGIPNLLQTPDWMNFETYYCRDTSTEGALLPSLNIVSSTDTTSAGVIKEYFFAVGASRDVIGIRVVANPQYLSPSDWYTAQGFTGTASEEQVDGFEAVRSGRTIYVAAPNVSNVGTAMYSNIYAISYNEDASAQTQQIFEQLLDNWNFAIALEDVRLCQEGGVYTSTVCSADVECSATAGAVCGSEKAKITRDTKRLADITTISRQLSAYAVQNRFCSQTTGLSCLSNADCPGTELCVDTYPQLDAGTFVRSIDSSAWPSWNEVLGTQIGAIPSDPLNRYNACGEGTAYGDHDAATCVNQTTGVYLCPENSYAYHYRSVGANAFELSAELEYVGTGAQAWVNAIDPVAGDQRTIRVGNANPNSGAGFSSAQAFCSNASYGGSDICGDGIVGPNEVCEVGQAGAMNTCDLNGDGAADSVRPTVCNASCTGFVETAGADADVCASFACGNGVIEQGEACDDGALNGQYGYCSSTCSGAGFFCGDGRIAGGESCDCGLDGSGVSASGGACSSPNGVYGSNLNNTCAWDCGGSAAFCGDSIIQAGEQCDGNVETWAGAVCRTGANMGDACTTDADCGGGVCGGSRPTNACPTSRVCLDGPQEGYGCTADVQCPGSTCSVFTVQTARTKTCADNGLAGDSCSWVGGDTFIGKDCRAAVSCGNGVVDAGEQCDDGNDVNTDACTNSCIANVCGDGIVQAGVEQCDLGTQNGQQCSSAYQSSCNYCSPTCTLLASSGAFCGDGVRNGGEFCDAGDLQYYWYSASTRTVRNDVATCLATQVGQTVTVAGVQYACTNIGACNGGVNNADLCSSNAQCGGGGSCVFPQCDLSCGSSCPLTLTPASVQFLDNQVGAVRSGTVDLLSASETLDAVLLGDPNAATAYIPACRVADDFIIDISGTNRSYPDVEVMFVLDESRSMTSSLGGQPRLQVLNDAVNDAIDALFDGYLGRSATMSIGLSSFGGSHFVPNTNRTEVRDMLVLSTRDAASRNRAEVKAAANLVLTQAIMNPEGTPLYEAIRDARDGFTDDPDSHKIIVIFSDGNVYNPQAEYASFQSHLATPYDQGGTMDAPKYMAEVSDLIDLYKSPAGGDIEVFTAILSSGACNAQQMQRWSSMTCTAQPRGCAPISAEGNHSCVVPPNGVNYAYQASTAEELRDMYESIVNSILNITVSLTHQGETMSVTLPAGSNTQLAIPGAFACNGLTEQSMTIKASFVDTGEGTVQLSGGEIDMCRP